MVQDSTEYGSRCPNCGNPFTKRDVLRRGPNSYLPVISGCDVCNSVWKEAEPSGAK